MKEYLYNLAIGKDKRFPGEVLKGVLFVLSLVYGVVVVALAGFYRIKPVRLGAKVISVGNITLGGTGKTTLVEYLSAKLSLAGNKVGVLTRGYKRDSRRAGAQGMGDEPAMLAKQLPQVPVIVDKNRVRAAQTAIRDYACGILILDDGLQQWRIFKDLEIVAIDVSNPFGNYRMLPAGFLREPLSALKRADIFVLTQIYPGQNLDSLTARLSRINAKALIVESSHKVEGVSRIDQPDKLINPEFLRGKPAVIFSGIGNPEGFQRSVGDLGVKVAKFHKFPDHYDYAPADILQIAKEAKENNLDTVITTQKDAVKIRDLGIKGLEILVLEIRLSIIKNEAEFDRRLRELYSF
ncbi:MAG: tetraacyldisaccharide 4'-kinase [Candidatus Omnitrophica bacterium]|nr:tetraacyldisaccharide 4'-kinase [Candidatus Omnitrophota bacterium]